MSLAGWRGAGLGGGMTMRQLSHARRLLCSLQDAIRGALAGARGRAGMAGVAGVTAADTIYVIDRVSEEAIMSWFEEHWPKGWPVEVVMEGIEEGEGLTFPRGTPVGKTGWKLILDPIDGTRGIMYDKRSAWALAGLAPQRGRRTTTRDIVVAAMTELPTAKQGQADQFSAVKGRGLVAERIELGTGARRKWRPRPSKATGFEHGFASVVKFFPEGKAWLAGLEERLWDELGLLGKNGGQLVFDDQYLATGGQLHELLTGHDRMVLDLRPVAFGRLGLGGALCCHPYDICTAMLLEEAGGVVEDPVTGKGLRVPLDTTTPVRWAGYANAALARQVRPVLKRLLLEEGVG